ncbi:MAG: hypothetical protein ACKOAU_09915, partial [Pirellula sp.]
LNSARQLTDSSNPSDIHARAVGKIWKDGKLTEPFARILERLTSPDKLSKEFFDSKCLTCHAGIQASGDNARLIGRPESEFSTDLKSTLSKDAIGCEACHGRGSNYVNIHTSAWWLKQSVSNKLTYGFYDLENSAIAAQVCLSCHLGSPEESKFVTHEMYAAGHPPLPPFDLAKFLESTCEKHWQELGDKSAQWSKAPSNNDLARVEYLQNHFQSSSDPSQSNPSIQPPSLQMLDEGIQRHFRKTQQSLVGQLTATLMSHDLLQHTANSETQWGDYAIYDCVGCHQVLYKSIRGSFGQAGRVPGRPQGLLWTKPADASLKLSEITGLDTLQTQIDAQLNAVPFGSKTGVQAALADYASRRQSASLQLVQRSRVSLNQEDADQWVRQYLSERRNLLGNEWVAKQVFWTLEAYFDDLERFAEKFPQTKPKSLGLLEKFRTLFSAAPPISRIVSCEPIVNDARERIDDAEFFLELRIFIDEFLGNQL